MARKKQWTGFFALLLALALAGCAGQAAQSPAGETSQPGSAAPSLAEASAGASQAPSAPEDTSFPPGVLENYESTRTLPQGPYTPFSAEELAAESTAWFHFLSPALMAGATGIVPQPVLVLQLEDTPGGIVLSRGVFETGARLAGFMGSYTYLENGTIEATLGEMTDRATSEGPYISQAETSFTLRIKIEKTEEAGLAVLTFTGANAVDNAQFQEYLAPFLAQPMAFKSFG